MIRFASLASCLVAVACGATVGETNGDSKASADGGAASSNTLPGTPPPDGAPGACCPPKGGACALVGGYEPSGRCPTQATLCDNLCNQRFVNDEHGCKKFEYDACSSTWPESPPQTQPGPVACNYPVVHNDVRCPATYSFTWVSKACPQVGLTCAYPGAGDGAPCAATAMMWCVGDAGVAGIGADAAVDAGPGTWLIAQ
ncbi:MAG: hypothetical protein IPG50_26610 [Myxococcales bacterium]|nr:hypothetical protein [Myxococcales bacterium]